MVEHVLPKHRAGVRFSHPAQRRFKKIRTAPDFLVFVNRSDVFLFECSEVLEDVRLDLI